MIPSHNTSIANEAVIRQHVQDKTLHLTFNRPAAKNSLNAELISALHAALDQVEQQSDLRCIVLWGNGEHFCTGMDFREAVQNNDKTLAEREAWNAQYMHLLHRFNAFPKIIIACVEGVVMAGGMGIVAASDFVIAHPRARFSLSEALWGLLPSMVLPYLIRRTGFQTAYRLTLTTETMSAEEAKQVRLTDTVSDDVPRALSLAQSRFYRLANETIQDMKRYMNQLYPITELMQQRAIQETARLAHEPRVQENIRCFIEEQRFPWEQRVPADE